MPNNNYNLVNLTPHAINICVDGKQVLEVPASGTVARCSQQSILQGTVNGIPVYKQVFGDVQDLPSSVEGTVYIVSRLVAAAVPNRDDLLIPGALVRDELGKVVGCEGLSIL